MPDTTAKIYTRDQLHAALHAVLDDIDHIADRIYDEAGTETDISPLLEEEP